MCDDGWDTADAQVACRQLGYLPTAKAQILTGPDVSDGTGQIWLEQVDCVGNEISLFDCNANNIGFHNCIHEKDAGVTCGKL